jgi:rRNA-processing protein Efg1
VSEAVIGVGLRRRSDHVLCTESRKATRAVKRAQKALDAAETEEQRTGLKRALHIAQIDHNYTLNYPMSHPYVAIYAKESEHLDLGRPRKGDPDMWDRVEKATADGTLEQLKNELVIRERTRTYPAGADVEMKDDEEGSDGGFFE